MNLSAQLLPAEVHSYSNPDSTCSDATAEVVQTAASAHRNPQETVFERSLRIKNTLDAFEKRARKAPSWEIMALLLNCEYKLWCLNAEIPLRQNPFLTHWVEAFQRSGKDNAERNQGADTTNIAEGRITTKEIFDVRADLIKRLLLNEDMKTFSQSTPRELHHTFASQDQTKPFDIQLYIQMLEDEGIYEKTPEPEVLVRRLEKGQSHSSSTSRQWTKDVAQKLKEQPDATIQELARLPLELSYLDFLTTILSNHTLESHYIDPAPIITSYVQHALRLTERMGEAPGTSTEATIDLYGAASGSADGSSIREYGKEAQSRAVKLLLLFIKNLIRKQLVETQVLYFEIQEICVRYVWIKEVRDFRGWVEEGIDEEQGERCGGG